MTLRREDFVNDFSAMLFEEMAAEREEKGRREIQNELIKNLLKVGTPIKFIVKATGLTEEEISKILADDTSKNLEV